MEKDLENFPPLPDVSRRPNAYNDYDLPHRQSPAELTKNKFLSAPIEPHREEVQSPLTVSYFKWQHSEVLLNEA